MAVSTALKEKSSPSGRQGCSIRRFVSTFRLPRLLLPFQPIELFLAKGAQVGSIIRWYGKTHRGLDFETPPHSREISINDFQIFVYRKPGIPFTIQPRKRSEFSGSHQIVN
jgi:hypothetical protein